MKTMKIILAGVLLMLPLLCQAQKNLFNKYGDMKGVSSVYISKAMIETNPNLFTKDVYIGKVSGQLNSVQVLSTMDNNVKKEMRKDLRSLVQSSVERNSTSCSVKASPVQAKSLTWVQSLASSRKAVHGSAITRRKLPRDATPPSRSSLTIRNWQKSWKGLSLQN
jgi:hypothetical protein